MNPFQIIHNIAEGALLDEQEYIYALSRIKDQAEHMLVKGMILEEHRSFIVDQVKSTTVEWVGRILTEIKGMGYKYTKIEMYSDLSGRVKTGLSDSEITLFSFTHIDRFASAYQWWKDRRK